MRRIAGLIARVVRGGADTTDGRDVVRETAAEVIEMVGAFPPYPVVTESAVHSATAR